MVKFSLRFWAAIGTGLIGAANHVPAQESPALNSREVVVLGQIPSTETSNRAGTESERVGPAQQPEWTTRRVFADTDIYVIPTGSFEVNQFFDSLHSRKDTPASLFETEFESGLPWRTQFDVELDYSRANGKTEYDGTLLELPHALADWGKIPLNPTINGGWRFIRDEPDAFFFRLLLADEFFRRIHFGADVTFDRQIGGERETSWELNSAVSYVVLDRSLSVGLEMRAEYEKAQADHEEGEASEGGDLGNGFEYSTSVLAGPSILYKPTASTHLSLVPLFGLTHDAPKLDVFLIFGIDFGTRGQGKDQDGAAILPLNSRARR